MRSSLLTFRRSHQEEDPLDSYSRHRRQACQVLIPLMKDGTDKEEGSLSAELESPHPISISPTQSLDSFSNCCKGSCDLPQRNGYSRRRLVHREPFHEDTLDLSQEQRLVIQTFHSYRRRPVISIQEPETETLVRFSTVTIREYPITVGDNPSSTRGVPLTVDWKHNREYTLQVNDFEDVRPTIRRSVGELQTQSLDRLRMLKAMGWSGTELREHAQGVDRARQLRLQTRQRVLHYGWLERFDEGLERIGRGVGNVTVRRNYKQWERQWLEQFRNCRLK